MMDATRTGRRISATEPLPVGTGTPPFIDFQRLERLRRLSRLMDTRWRIPGTRIPVGWDGIASLVPVAGDTLTAVVSAYIILEAARFDLPKALLARMMLNVFVDWLFGSVPVLGTVFDIAFKANRMNVDLLHEHLEERLGNRPPER